EDPVRFLPSPGAITEWSQPAGPGIRVDAGYEAGNTVTPFYDPLLAKLCVHGGTRDEALGRAREAVEAFRLAGPKTNLPFHAVRRLSSGACVRRLRSGRGGSSSRTRRPGSP